MKQCFLLMFLFISSSYCSQELEQVSLFFQDLPIEVQKKCVSQFLYDKMVKLLRKYRESMYIGLHNDQVNISELFDIWHAPKECYQEIARHIVRVSLVNKQFFKVVTESLFCMFCDHKEFLATYLPNYNIETSFFYEFYKNFCQVRNDEKLQKKVEKNFEDLFASFLHLELYRDSLEGNSDYWKGLHDITCGSTSILSLSNNTNNNFDTCIKTNYHSNKCKNITSLLIQDHQSLDSDNIKDITDDDVHLYVLLSKESKLSESSFPKSVKTLLLKCGSFDFFENQLEQLKQITKLELFNCYLGNLGSVIGKLGQLRDVSIIFGTKDCRQYLEDLESKESTILLSSLKKVISLKLILEKGKWNTFDINKILFSDLKKLPCLKELYLVDFVGFPMVSLPGLKKLYMLYDHGFKKTYFSKYMKNLQDITIKKVIFNRYMTVNTDNTLQSIYYLTLLKKLNFSLEKFSRCRLSVLPALHKLLVQGVYVSCNGDVCDGYECDHDVDYHSGICESLKILHIKNTCISRWISCLHLFSKLEKLIVELDCVTTKYIKLNQSLLKLKTLCINSSLSSCFTLADDFFEYMPKLEKCSITYMKGLKNIPDTSMLNNLRTFVLRGIPTLESIDESLFTRKKLRKLEITYCPNLILPKLDCEKDEVLPNLEYVDVYTGSDTEYEVDTQNVKYFREYLVE